MSYGDRISKDRLRLQQNAFRMCTNGADLEATPAFSLQRVGDGSDSPVERRGKCRPPILRKVPFAFAPQVV